MRALIQRSKAASVSVEGRIVGSIDFGLCILIAASPNDTADDIDFIVKKSIALRIFNDNEGKLNLDVRQVGGGILLISQFTLYADTKKGNRPSFFEAAKPDVAEKLYNQTIIRFRENGTSPQTGIFGADMQVSLVNNGPVTIWLDSKTR